MVCPVCHKDDQSQKASAVFSGGVGTTSYGGPTTTVTNVDGKWGVGGGYISGTGHTITNVASKCAPPQRPSGPGTPSKIWLGGLLILSTCCCVFGSFMGGDEIDNVWVFVILPIIILGLVLVSNGNEEKKGKEEMYQEALRVYERELAQWNRLYYCHRDDILFDPQTGDYWEFTQK